MFSQKTKPIGLAHGFRIQWEEVQNAYVLLYPEGMVTLNGSAGEILLLCDGSRNQNEIVAELTQAFNDDSIEQDINEFLKEAQDNGWITYQRKH